MDDDFNVVPADLDTFAGSLRDLSDQATAAKNYATKWFDVSAGEARIYVFVKSMVEQIRQNLEGNYDKLSKISDGSATALTTAAQSYRSTDGASAARLDKMIAEVPK